MTRETGFDRFRMSCLTAAEVRAALLGAVPAAVILPLGSQEDHGPGAPMGDFVLAEAIAVRIAQRATLLGVPALVAPPLPFGGADFFTRVTGGLTLSQGTLRCVLDELLGGLVGQGVRRLLVVNGHGGSLGPVLDAARALRDATGVLVPTLSIWKAAAAMLVQSLGSDAAGARLGHGADPVLSVSLALRAHLTRAIAPPPSAPPQIAGLPITSFSTARLGEVEIDLPLESGLVAPHGVFGADPSLCDARTGEMLVERLAEAGARILLHVLPDEPGQRTGVQPATM